MQFLHVFTTMQCAAMARVVFVKSVKQAMNNGSFVSPDDIEKANKANAEEKGLEMTALVNNNNDADGDEYRPPTATIQ